MKRTDIEYLTHTWNPVVMRCTRISSGCANCWHLRMADRLAGVKTNRNRQTYAGKWTPFLRENELTRPLHMNARAVIGVQFMGDLFHESLGLEVIYAVLDVTQVEASRYRGTGKGGHTFVFLTKRAHIMKHVFNAWVESYKKQGAEPDLSNIWLGVSVENQVTADARIPALLETAAAHRWVSYEPALGPIEFQRNDYSDKGAGPGWLGAQGNAAGTRGIEWLVVGAETGPGARPMNMDWARSARDQAAAAGVRFFFKSAGNNVETPRDLRVREFGPEARP